MSKITRIDYGNFKEYVGKKIEVEISCYEGGMMYPENNTLVGMNPDNYYFISEQGTEDETYWHWPSKDDTGKKHEGLNCSINVWPKDEYDAYYNPASKILQSFGYTELLKAYPEYVSEHGLDTLDYDTESLVKIRELKNATLAINTYMISAYLRDIENEITKGAKQTV